MQIVIEIDEEEYEKNKTARCDYHTLRMAIMNGIPIPKGHGDLIDRRDLLQLESKWYHLPNGDVACPKIDIEHAPTIIPAERSDTE